jgi:hypothetical protein
MPLDTERIYHGITANPDTGGTMVAYSWVFWHAPSINAPSAMDVGKHNASIVYVGTKDAIIKSIDGAESFAEYIPEIEAYDIECYRGQDPLDGNLKIWTDDGKMYWTWRTVLNLVRYQEIAGNKVHLRIASQPVSARPTWLLAGTASEVFDLIKGHMPYSVNHETKASDIPHARSLVFTRGDTTDSYRLFYLSASEILYSEDWGETIDDKIGDWSGYANGVRIFPMLEGNEND